MKRASLVLSLLSFLCFAGSGSTGLRAQTGAKADDPYALEPMVIEHAETVYHFAVDGTGSHERSIVVRVQTESALKQMGVLTVPFAAKAEHVEWVYARVRHRDGTVTETPPGGAIEIADPVTKEAPFYSDLKQMQLPLKDLRVGDTVEWKANVVRTVAEAPNEFWGADGFTKGVVVLSEIVELDVPKGKYVKVWSPKYKPVESDRGDVHVYRWETSSKKLTVGPEADAAAEAEKKRVRTSEDEVDDREGKLADLEWSTFKDWAAVGAWYRGLEGERMLPDAEIKAKVAQITAGKTTELEKVQAVYTYVATQIHYIGVAFGVGRYQPHSAPDVLGNQYGDCKDKHTLLAAMLEALGLQPDAVLIGAGIRFNDAVPSPQSFNHLITRVQVQGQPVWLDSTAEVAPFGMLMYVTRDRRALVVPPTGEAKIERTPAKPPFAVLQTMQAVGSLDADGQSKSRITLTFRGDDEIIMRSVIRSMSPGQYDQLAQQVCASMGYAGTASHTEVGRAEDMSEPMKMSFDYKRDKAGDWDNLRTIPQLAPVTLYRPDKKEPPVQSISLGVPRVEASTSAMKLPEGWGVEFPEAVHERSPYATYDETYRFEKGTMYADRRVEVLQERVPQADWQTWSRFVEKAGLGNEQYIQLIRHDAGKTAAVTGPPKDKPAKNEAAATPVSEMNATEKDAEVQRLLTECATRFQNNDVEGAAGLLDQAKALNSKHQGLYAMYGLLAFRKGDLPGAEEGYRKELDLHPSNTAIYPLLVQVELARKEKSDAKQSLGRWQEAAPADARPAMQLVSMEIADGEAAAAVKTSSDALARTPADEKKNERLELMLGQAQLKAGMKEDGHQTLAALLKSTDNPDMMNDVAYELADAGFELPLAEQTTRAALDKLEAESRTWTLDESLGTLRQRTQMLQATWDTMGWIYFRDGKVNEAERYIRAAWEGRQDLEVGKHLGEIELARGNKNAALTDYELAQAAAPSYDMMGVHTEPNAMQKELMRRTEELRKQGAHSTISDARESLQKVRTIPLGPAAGLNGVAEYKLLVSGDAVQRVVWTGSKTLPGGEERLKKAKLNGFIPTGSQAQLALSAMLNCHSDVCELVLMP